MTIFQKIIDKQVPAYTIYEDDRVLAFLDIHPAMPGHMLIIPKTHSEFVWDIPEDDYLYLMGVVQKLALHLREKMPQKYVNMMVVGTDVPHAHVHLVPFDNSSDLHKPDRMSTAPDHQKLSEIAAILKLN